MKKLAAAFLSLLVCLCLTACSQEKTEELFVLPDSYQLAFADEFDQEIDEDIWCITDTMPRKGGYWGPEAVRTEDGHLIIQTEYREFDGGAGYYTGIISWAAKRSTYGYYEIRCKVDNIRGAWSAFWLMPDDLSGTEHKARDGCEIDIFESALPYKFQNALHYDSYKGGKKNVNRTVDLYDGFHTFALDWKKDSMKFYYDNKLVWELTDPDLISQYPVAMEISTEINGNLKDEIPVPSRWLWLGCGKIDDKDNTLPSQFIVDYVSVYDNGDLIWSEK